MHVKITKKTGAASFLFCEKWLSTEVVKQNYDRSLGKYFSGIQNCGCHRADRSELQTIAGR